MNRACLIFALWLACFYAVASTLPDVDAYRQQALATMGQLNPASILNDYTAQPPQINLPASTNPEAVSALAREKVQADAAARALMDSASIHAVKNNPNAPEMQYAERLISDADSVLKGGCYKTPAECQTQWSHHTCEESATFTDSVCEDRLIVDIKHQTSFLTRRKNVGFFQMVLSFSLTSCDKWGDWTCSKFLIDEHCEQLRVDVYESQKKLTVLSAPTCKNPTVSVQIPPQFGANLRTFKLKITQAISHDRSQKATCDARRTQSQATLCTLSDVDACISPNETKIVDGIPIYRACWGARTNYHCREPITGDCEPFLARGCSQSASICAQKTGTDCTRFTQTFQCPTQTCLPEKTICSSEPIGCADGACDKTLSDASNDINDGLVHLGALGGSALDATNNQVSSGVAAIFSGTDTRCKSWPLGFRDCCTDSGWGSWALHCPADMQALLKAKSEHRVKEVGAYTHNLLRYHTYCVFPSKLAGILQLQGRDAQLHIPFGEPKEPNCRGLSPEEIERINFDALDLGALAEDFNSKKNLPNAANVDAKNTQHTTQLYQQGVPND